MAVARFKDKEGNVQVLGNLKVDYEVTSAWEPEADWFDIETILENDTENYPAKMIILLTDGLDEMTFTMNTSNHIAKIKTSDGAEYTQTSTHSWDISKDKKCSLGYKTRYYIVYFNSTSATIRYNQLPLAQNKFSNLFIIVQNLELTSSADSNTSWLNNHLLLESIKLNNSKLIENKDGALLNNNKSLVDIDASKIYINKSGNRCFAGCSSLETVDGINIADNANGATSMFQNTGIKRLNVNLKTLGRFDYFISNSKVMYIDLMDFISAYNINNMFKDATYLAEVGEVKNIKISGIDISPCVKLNHETRLRFIDALYDFSEDTENVHNIIFGPTLMAKLGDEDKARIVLKGWTAA